MLRAVRLEEEGPGRGDKSSGPADLLICSSGLRDKSTSGTRRSLWRSRQMRVQALPPHITSEVSGKSSYLSEPHAPPGPRGKGTPGPPTPRTAASLR